MRLAIIFLCALLLSACSNSPQRAEAPAATPPLNTTIAELLQQSKKINGAIAIATLADIAAESGGNPESLYNLAYAHFRNAQARQDIAEHDLAITYFNEILLMVPGNQAVIGALYNIYYDDTLRNRNASAFAKASDYFWQMPDTMRRTTNPPSLAKFIALAVQQETLKQPDRQALRETLLKAIQEQPFNDSAYIQLARIYSEDHYFSLAIATLKLAAENITDSAALYKTIASTYEQRANVNNCSYENPRDITSAANYYKLAIPLAPDDQDLHYRLANAFIDQGQGNLGLHESSIAMELQASSLSLGTTAQDYSILSHSPSARQLLARALSAGMPISETGYHEINMNLGEWQKAAEGFAAYIKTRQTFSIYDLIKSDIIAQQSQQASWLRNSKISLANDWEETLSNYWNGNISAAIFQKKAINRCEKTEFYFYSGYRDWQSGEKAQARIKFAEALKQNTYRFIERPLAQYFLQR
ncbi:MAG TPA: hypothetical protein VN030_00875 [Cellvibrio sp.]|nr:hypothetical protein [Cellvibrio sp.]